MSQNAAAKPVALVVEDDVHIASLMKFILEQEGYEVELAGDLRSAGALIAKISSAALVTVDINLPDGSGIDLLPRIKESPGWERVPIVMVTAQAQHQDVSRALQSGATAYIVKPFKPDALRDTLRLVAKRSPAKPST